MTMIATKTLEIYATTDGREFTDLSEAQQHQAVLEAQPRVEAFVEAQQLENDRAKTRVRNLLTAWVAFNAA